VTNRPRYTNATRLRMVRRVVRCSRTRQRRNDNRENLFIAVAAIVAAGRYSVVVVVVW